MASEYVPGCPYCDLLDDGWLGVHTPSYVKGRYSNGSTMYTPECSVCGDIGAVGSTGSPSGAVSLAKASGHCWGEDYYCDNLWHKRNGRNRQ